MHVKIRIYGGFFNIWYCEVIFISLGLHPEVIPACLGLSDALGLVELAFAMMVCVLLHVRLIGEGRGREREGQRGR